MMQSFFFQRTFSIFNSFFFVSCNIVQALKAWLMVVVSLSILSFPTAAQERRESASGDVLNGASRFSSSNASGGLGVQFSEQGDAIRLFNVPASSGLQLRYAAENTTLVGIQINNDQAQGLSLPATGSDFDQFEDQTLTQAIPNNATITIFLPDNRPPVGIDFVDFLPIQTGTSNSNPSNTNLPNDNLVRCNPPDAEIDAGRLPVLRIPLAVHVGGSGGDDQTICGILEETNEIWFEAAGICFEMTIDRQFVNRGTPRQDRNQERRNGLLNFWILSRGNLFPAAQQANGVFLGSEDEAYTLLNPGLRTVGVIENTQFAAARTGAHELGHALRLNHQDCGAPCNNLLMRSGHRGFALVTGTPANTDEISRARSAAVQVRQRALDDTTQANCSAPRFIE